MGFTAQQIAQGRLADGGPIYRETDLSHFVAEPFNGISALLFFFIAAYWLFKIGRNFRSHLFLSFLLVILAVGGVGGTLFHAFRAKHIFFLMDVVPIMVAGTLTGLYVWTQVFRRPVYALVALPPFVLFQRWFAAEVSRQWAITVSYLCLALLILVPLFLLVRKEGYRGLRLLSISVGCFLVAVFFRYVDRFPLSWIPQGTHWLWHTFSAIAVFFLAKYLVQRATPATVNNS